MPTEDISKMVNKINFRIKKWKEEQFSSFFKSDKNFKNFWGLYHKHITIINDDSRVINKLETSLTDDARVINYDLHLFIIQATGVNVIKLFSFVADNEVK